MWAIIKSDKKKFSFMQKDLEEKLGKDLIIYSPKILVDKFKKNRMVAIGAKTSPCSTSKFKKKLWAESKFVPSMLR